MLVALKMTKMSSLLSMLASTAAYSFLYGLPFGVGMIGLILVHESGHALMMKRLGYDFTPMVFLPFMGAVVGMKEPPKSAYDDAKISLAGPVLGGLGAAGVALTGVALDNQFLMALGDFGLMINLFNLLPIGSLDGAHVIGALNKWLQLGTLGGGIFVAYQGYIVNPMFYLLLFGSAFSTYERFTGGDDGRYNRAGYEMPRNQKIIIGTSYFALIFVLLGLMRVNNQFRKSPQQIKREQQMEAIKRGEKTVQEETFGDTFMNLSKELEDPSYFGADEAPSSKHLHEHDPYFNKNTKWT